MATLQTKPTKSPVIPSGPASQAAWWVSALAFAVMLGLMLPTLQAGVRGDNQAQPNAKAEPKDAKGRVDPPLFDGPLGGDDYRPSTVEPPSLGDIGLKLVMAMALLVGVGAGMVALAKKAASGARAGKSAGALQLIDTLHLGRRCELHLVEIEGTRVLVGVDPTGMRTVTHLPDEYRDLAPVDPSGSPAAIAAGMGRFAPHGNPIPGQFSPGQP